jgi:hypothetical protein
MSEKSRRIDLCSVCLDLRIRDADFEANELTVHLPTSCQFKEACRLEMRYPFGTIDEPQR